MHDSTTTPMAETAVVADAPLAPNLDKDLLFEYTKKTTATFTAEIIFTVLLNVLLFSIFILIFFFILAARVEQNVVKTSMTTLVKDLCNDLKFVLTDAQIAEVSTLLNNMHLPNMKDIDQQVKDANAKLMKNALIALGSAAAVVFVIILVSYFSMKSYTLKHNPAAKAGVQYPAIWKVLRLVLYSFLAVIFTELVFLYTVAAQFQPLDENKVKLTIIQYIQTLAKKPSSSSSKAQSK